MAFWVVFYMYSVHVFWSHPSACIRHKGLYGDPSAAIHHCLLWRIGFWIVFYMVNMFFGLTPLPVLGIRACMETQVLPYIIVGPVLPSSQPQSPPPLRDSLARICCWKSYKVESTTVSRQAHVDWEHFGNSSLIPPKNRKTSEVILHWPTYLEVLPGTTFNLAWPGW